MYIVTLPCIAVAVTSTANGVHPFRPNSDDVMHGIQCVCTLIQMRD